VSDASWHGGGCHCGAVTFAVQAHLDGDDAHEVVLCNCSICRLKGFVHLIVEQDAFRITQGEEHLSTYTFGTHTAKHMFCSRCGIHPFYRPRSHPEGWSVNANALDAVREGRMKVRDLPTVPFDGQNWEENIEALLVAES